MTVITRLNMQFELMHVSAFNNYNTFSSDIFNNYYFLDSLPWEDSIYKVKLFSSIFKYINDFLTMNNSANNKFDGISSYGYTKMVYLFEISLFSTQKA